MGTSETGVQLLKCRDDQKPVYLKRKDGSEDGTHFEIAENSECSWAKPGDTLSPAKLRTRIEPWLTALCQTEHLSLLVGSGLTLAVNGLACSTDNMPPNEVLAQASDEAINASPMNQADFGEFQAAIDAEVKRSAKATNRNEGNFEDQLRVANELLRGFAILKASSKSKLLRRLINTVLDQFAASILEGERELISAPNRENALNYLVSFLMTFAARSGTRDRLHLFTTNYDRLLEAGADAAGLHLLDRFVGALSPIFRSSRLDLDIHYNPPGIRGEPRYLEGVARFTKLHGSIDWVESERNIRRLGVPFGARSVAPYLQADPAAWPTAAQLMIYPNAAKDRETAAYPYVELFRDLAASICRPNTTLVTYGYSFGDEHINRVIADMLTIPSTHLVIISYDDRLGRILKTYERIGRPSQLSLLVGDHLGSLPALVDHYLPKPAIDRTTFRMAELLKSRWGTTQAEAGQATHPGPLDDTSGDSGSVAGLIRWSLEEARKSRTDGNAPNARFIILDPNGEYAKAFSDASSGVKARIYSVNAADAGSVLRVPLWFWNSAEWAAFTQASARAQKPALIQALRHVRDGLDAPQESKNHELRRFLRTVVTSLQIERNAGTPWGSFPRPKSFYEKLEKWRSGLESDVAGSAGTPVDVFAGLLEELCAPRRVQYPQYDFERADVTSLIEAAREAHASVGGNDDDVLGADADAPRPFTGDAFVRSVEATAEMMGVAEFTETLLIRIRALLSDVRMKRILGDRVDFSLAQWLEEYVGQDGGESPLTVLDLSLVPSEVIHTITAVASRMIFEALQRYRKLNDNALPTVLVMEEAHTFVRRYRDDVENQDAATVCCQVFERIAREGRKFGLGLVLSSQRPSELSPTVLSQCNTFLLHRISNDRDQELVRRLVPDNLRGLLRELPSLPSQYAILLGWASELPVMVKMEDLPEAHRPHSSDPDFWDVWTGKDQDGKAVSRPIDWKSVADDWQSPSHSGGVSDNDTSLVDGDHEDEGDDDAEL
jgi:DNA helicase HerA-like ATPase